MVGLVAVAFGIAWWLGLYLLARGPGKPVLRRAGLGLLGYAVALVVDQLGLGGTAHIGVVLACLPALAWSGVFVRLADGSADDSARDSADSARDSADSGGDSAGADRWWRFAVLPLFGLAAVAVLAGYRPAVIALGVLVGLALAGGLLVLARRRPVLPRRDRVGLGLIAALMVMLVGWLLLLGFEVLPSGVLLACMAPDLVALGCLIAVFDAFDEGEVLAPDMLRSALAATLAAVIFGGQVAIAAVLSEQRLTGQPLAGLLYGTIAAAIAVQVLATPLQAAVDRVVLRSARLRRDRSELRGVADALARKDSANRLGELDDAEFARLTRRALSHYGDLGKLVVNPLVDLPVITARLADRGAADAPLARAGELKALLGECIGRLKPATVDEFGADDEFGTSEEWRHYNALYFYYLRGIRPYSVRTKRADLDPASRRALSWFADQVPERTLHNWQTAAARIIARELRSGVGVP